MTERDSAGTPPERKWDYPGRDEHPDEEIFIYGPWCKSCGICYSLCPQGVLGSDKAGRPVVENPEACTACCLCEMLCPDFAITVHKERGGGGRPASEASEGGNE